MDIFAILSRYSYGDKMRDQLRNNASVSGVTVILSVFTLLFGFLCALFGELAFPLYTASLAALFLYDKNSKRIVSVLIPIASVAINLLMGSPVPTAVVFAIPAALVLSIMYKKGLSKGECAGYITAISTVMIVVGVFALAMVAIREFSISGAVEYFGKIYDTLIKEFMNYLEQAASLSQNQGIAAGFDEETVRTLFGSLVLVIPSLVVIAAFLITGLTAKVFTFIVSRFSDRPDFAVNWRFSTGNLYAYFYIAVVLLSSLAGASDIPGIALANIRNVFMIVYAYIGFNYVHYVISRSRSSFFATAVLIAAILALSSFALSLLSFIGVYFTVVKNKTLQGIEKDK